MAWSGCDPWLVLSFHEKLWSSQFPLSLCSGNPLSSASCCTDGCLPYQRAEGAGLAVPIVVVLVAQSCPTLCDPVACSPPGSSVHGIPQASILEWVAISSSMGSSQPRDQTHVSYMSCIGRWILYISATWEAQLLDKCYQNNNEILPHIWQNGYHQKVYK